MATEFAVIATVGRVDGYSWLLTPFEDLDMIFGFAWALVSITLFTAAGIVGPRPLQVAAVDIQATRGAAFTARDRQIIFRAIVSDPRLADVRSHRLRELTVVRDTPEKQNEIAVSATSVIFDYTTGRAYRVRLNLATGRVAAFETLPGRPQASLDEIAQARAIVMRDASNASLFAQGARLEGGFVDDAPPGANSHHRYVQFHIITRDYKRIIRVVVVDLTDGKIAASTGGR